MAMVLRHPVLIRNC